MSKRMKVLIGYDGSSYADAAVDDLRRAGLPSETEALVVSVANAPIIPPLASHNVIEKAFVGERVVSIVEHANKQASQVLQQANELALNASGRLKSYFPDWQARGEALAGTPALELMRKAEEWKAELIVVGSQGRSAIGRLILGSVSLQVASESRCSVRIGRRRAEKSDQMEPRILIGLDGSAGGERAVRKVLMRAWPEGTELRILAVDDGDSPITIADVVSISDKHVREDTSITASRMIKLAGARGLIVSAVIKKGDPQRALIAEAREWEADCIVIGSRGFNSTPQGFFASGVSTGLAANAECSIEIVR
ncbi:MAG: universal stress protein [Acidobacteriota bacterium]|nr:universal stress protein [Acidobacteriota bacterium]